MSTAVLVTILVFAFLIGGMVTLLKSANKHKLPDNYDKTKVGFDDEDDDWPKDRSNSKEVESSNDKKNELS